MAAKGALEVKPSKKDKYPKGGNMKPKGSKKGAKPGKK